MPPWRAQEQIYIQCMEVSTHGMDSGWNMSADVRIAFRVCCKNVLGTHCISENGPSSGD